MSRKFHRYTEEQKQWLIKQAKNYDSPGLHKAFNEKFNLNVTDGSLGAYRYRQGIKINKDKIKNTGRFKKGSIPWNKGKKLPEIGKKTWFKSGRQHVHYRPPGSETIGSDGVRVKIADPDKWRAKHILEWEKVHGQIPKNHFVIHADSDKTNNDINNLILVNNGQLRRLHHQNLIKKDGELTKLALKIVTIEQIIDEKSK